jgi:hypothetical protein
MYIRKRVGIAIIAVSLVLPVASRSQDPTTYRAGLKSMAIPAPATDLVELGPDYRVLLEPLAPTTNRLIAGFVMPADADAIRSSKKAALTRYALVEVLRRAEFTELSPSDFKQFTDTLGAQLGETVNAHLKDSQDEINRRIKALGSASAEVTLDKPIQLGILFCKPDACASGMIMPITSNGTTKKMAAGLISMRLQSRLVFLYTYTEYKDESTIQDLRSMDERWVDAILQANK